MHRDSFPSLQHSTYNVSTLPAIRRFPYRHLIKRKYFGTRQHFVPLLRRDGYLLRSNRADSQC